MFHDYLALLLVNMTAGLTTLAAWLIWGLDRSSKPGQLEHADQPDLAARCARKWTSAFAIVGLVATAAGLHMALTWPLPKMEKFNAQFANVAFGETSVMLGALFLAAALSLAKGWDLLPLGIYSFFAGLAGIVVGVSIGLNNLTAAPMMSAIGFVLAGAGGVLFGPALLLRRHRAAPIALALLLLAAAALWAFVGFGSYFKHVESFGKV